MVILQRIACPFVCKAAKALSHFHSFIKLTNSPEMMNGTLPERSGIAGKRPESTGNPKICRYGPEYCQNDIESLVCWNIYKTVHSGRTGPVQYGIQSPDKNLSIGFGQKLKEKPG